MQTSCRTCPESPEEIKKIIDAGYFPELIVLSDYSETEKRELLIYFTDIYGEHLKLLLSAKSTGYFTDEIDDEIEDCRAVLKWIEEVSLLD